MPRVHHVRQATQVLAVAVGLLGIGAVLNAQSQLSTARDVDVAPREAVTTDQPRRAPPAARARPWTLEVRGGIGLSTNPTAGTAQLPRLGNVILPAGGSFGPARTVSSWLFGDGAAQLNAFAPTRSLPPLPALDAMLTSLGATRGAGGTLGFAIGRDLSAHLAIDFAVDANLQALRMTSAATSALEATRAGFVKTWQALLLSARSGFFTGLSVAATTTGATSAGSQLEAIGSVKYRVRPGATLDPFIMIGAGVLANTGSAPSPVLTGTYQFTFPSSGVAIPYKQTDTVTIHALDGGARLVGVLGAGIDKVLSARSGIRVAARATITSNRAETTLDANPTTQVSVPEEGLFFESAPTTIIINNGSLPSSLSASPLVGFQTFVGRGIRIESTITVGLLPLLTGAESHMAPSYGQLETLMRRVSRVVYFTAGDACTPAGAPCSRVPAASLRPGARLILMGLGTTLGLLGIATIASAQIPLAPPPPVAPPTPDTSAGMRTARTLNASGRPVSAAAPARPGTSLWTIEVRGGLGLSTNPTGGIAQLPAVGSLILSPEFAFGQARTVSSWLFGDGASQLNSIAASLPNVPLLPALDSALTSPSATRRTGGSIGFTIGRDISEHVRADLNVDGSFQALALTSAATNAIEATRAGFVSTWQGVLGSSPISGLVVSATRTGPASAGRQVQVSGTLTYRFRPRSSLDPFLTYGVGLLTNAGSTPSAVLTGNVQFTIIGPYTETDLVTVHASDGGSRYVGVIGGGIDKGLSLHGGLRFTARLAIGSNKAETTIDASPTNQLSWITNELLISSRTTTLVINNGPPAPGLFGLQSTLSGKPISGFPTFVGGGLRIESTVTVGYFIRF